MKTHSLPLLDFALQNEVISEINLWRRSVHGCAEHLEELDRIDIKADLQLGSYSTYECPTISSWIRAQGYDAIYMSEEDYTTEPTLAVFSGSQIKSTVNHTLWNSIEPYLVTPVASSLKRAPWIPTTGKPVALNFSRNTESSKLHNIGNADYGQALEPAGEYMNVAIDHGMFAPNEKWEAGAIVFFNPLALPHKSTDSYGWKRDLSEMFKGKTGKHLRKAIIASGFDGIITYDAYGASETVNLAGQKFTSLAQSSVVAAASRAHQFISAKNEATLPKRKLIP